MIEHRTAYGAVSPGSRRVVRQGDRLPAISDEWNWQRIRRPPITGRLSCKALCAKEAILKALATGLWRKACRGQAHTDRQ